VYREFACKGYSAEQDPKHEVCLVQLNNLKDEIEAFQKERQDQLRSIPVKDLLIDKAYISIQYIFGEFREFRLWP